MELFYVADGQSLIRTSMSFSFSGQAFIVQTLIALAVFFLALILLKSILFEGEAS